MAQQHEEPDPTPPVTAIEPPPQPSPRAQSRTMQTVRSVVTWVLVVLACMVAAVSALAIWTNEVLLDTSRFISVVKPISSDPEVDAVISARTADELVRALRIQERAEEVLPSRAGFLAYTLREAAQQIIEEQIQNLLAREGVQDAWIASLRFAHQQIVAVLRDQVPSIVSQNGVVSLNLFPLIQAALQRLEGTGLLPSQLSLPNLGTVPPDEARQQLSSAVGVQLPADFGVIPIAEAPQLEKAQRAVSIFDDLTAIVPVNALLLMAGAIALSINRRRTVVALGVGTGAALVLLGLIADLLGEEAVKAVSDRPSGPPVVQAVVDALTDDLWGFLRPAIVVALVIALVAFLAGRRTWFVAAGAAASATARPAGRWLVDSSRLVARYDDALRIAGLVVALAVLFIVNLSWGALLFVIAGFLLYAAAVTLIAERWRTTASSGSTP